MRRGLLSVPRFLPSGPAPALAEELKAGFPSRVPRSDPADSPRTPESPKPRQDASRSRTTIADPGKRDVSSCREEARFSQRGWESAGGSWVIPTCPDPVFRPAGSPLARQAALVRVRLVPLRPPAVREPRSRWGVGQLQQLSPTRRPRGSAWSFAEVTGPAGPGLSDGLPAICPPRRQQRAWPCSPGGLPFFARPAGFAALVSCSGRTDDPLQLEGCCGRYCARLEAPQHESRATNLPRPSTVVA